VRAFSLYIIQLINALPKIQFGPISWPAIMPPFISVINCGRKFSPFVHRKDNYVMKRRVKVKVNPNTNSELFFALQPGWFWADPGRLLGHHAKQGYSFRLNIISQKGVRTLRT